MGLIHNLIAGILNLIFVAMDVLFLVVFLKLIYDRWRFAWLRQVNGTVTPLINHITATMQTLAFRINGKIYSEKTLLTAFILGLSAVRLFIGGVMS